ncbi:MAG TPA: NAD(P)-dependent oxidoreductase [Candidatus Saccharimonadales bacterium]|nr:NAD(P)-dependent oxidoreductase [Candidatus Saccharimonadales bacterium]
MRVLLIGGSGFIGSRLLARLLEEGHQINLVVNRTPPTVPEGPDVKYHKVDLLDPVNFRSAGFKADAAVNVAGQLRVQGIPDEHYWKVHYEATKHILEECIRFKLRRIVLVSTTGVYGVTGRQPVGEEGPIRPSDIYEKTKWEAERYATEFCSGGALELVVARPSLVYGPGDRHLLGLFKAIRSGLFRVVGDGENLVHPIYVDDLVDGLLACLQRPEAAGRTYNLVGRRPVSFRKFCEAVAGALGKKLPAGSIPPGLARAAGAFFEVVQAVGRITPPLTRGRVEFMTSDRAYDGSRARTEIGFDAGTDLEEGMARTVAWYREKGLL